ncbi:MAG TPA: crotonyl-CoA carboxylase/reductase, partial [Actinomycetota bacterium]|nr:crotonyl-CoA carboxylase/reductase [Actinomycetota bacterium]
CLSRTFPFHDIGKAHQLMGENAHPEGNMAALVSAPREGLTDLPT